MVFPSQMADLEILVHYQEDSEIEALKIEVGVSACSGDSVRTQTNALG